VREIAVSPLHFTAVMPELNGLGGPASDELRSLLARRPGWAGGARPARGWRMLLETGGPGDEWERELERPRPARRLGFATAVKGVHLTAQIKSAGYAALRSLLERQLLLVPASAAELRAELLGLRVTLTETGERIEGASDDLADALMLALRPQRYRDGGLGTALGMLADERVRLPGPDFPPGWRGPGPEVETASGLRVPAEPAWQSVAGREVTVPGAAPPTGEDLEAPIPLARRAYD
jgi:hypothetical protein